MDERATGPHGDGEPEGDLGAEIRTGVGRLYRRFRAERADGALGDAARGVLALLYKNGPMTLKALSEHDRVTPPSMSQIVNRLTAAGYVVRGSDPSDGRRVLFSATSEGIELAIADRAKRRTWLDARLAEVSDDDRAALARAAALFQQFADS